MGKESPDVNHGLLEPDRHGIRVHLVPHRHSDNNGNHSQDNNQDPAAVIADCFLYGGASLSG